MKLSIIVPCYNEVDNVSKLHDELLPVVADLLEHGWSGSLGVAHSAEIIFVDDGSFDETYSSLKKKFDTKHAASLKFKFLKHSVNMGLGAAIRTGFKNADGDILITVDSDGTYKFSEIPVMLSYLKTDVDIVTASPYHPEGKVVGVPAYRLLLSKGSSLIYRIFVDWRIHTYTSLFRVYRSEVVKRISFNSDGFLAGTELLVNAMLSGYKVAEFPAVLHKRLNGVSKAKIVQTILAHLRFQFRIVLARMQLIMGLKSGQVT
jgi:dolichol-phosphate mannosyltransferase